MEIKNNKKVIYTGSHICLVLGFLSMICLTYWLVQAFFYRNDKFLMIFISFASTIAGFWYGFKKKK